MTAKIAIVLNLSIVVSHPEVEVGTGYSLSQNKLIPKLGIDQDKIYFPAKLGIFTFEDENFTE